MKYSKEKKEKIKKGAIATAGALLFIGANIGLTLGVVSAVQGVKTETEVERLTKALAWLEGKMKDKITAKQKENDDLQFKLDGVRGIMIPDLLKKIYEQGEKIKKLEAELIRVLENRLWKVEAELFKILENTPQDTGGNQPYGKLLEEDKSILCRIAELQKERVEKHCPEGDKE